MEKTMETRLRYALLEGRYPIYGYPNCIRLSEKRMDMEVRRLVLPAHVVYSASQSLTKVVITESIDPCARQGSGVYEASSLGCDECAGFCHPS